MLAFEGHGVQKGESGWAEKVAKYDGRDGDKIGEFGRKDCSGGDAGAFVAQHDVFAFYDIKERKEVISALRREEKTI